MTPADHIHAHTIGRAYTEPVIVARALWLWARHYDRRAAPFADSDARAALADEAAARAILATLPADLVAMCADEQARQRVAVPAFRGVELGDGWVDVLVEAGEW